MLTYSDESDKTLLLVHEKLDMRAKIPLGIFTIIICQIRCSTADLNDFKVQVTFSTIKINWHFGECSDYLVRV